jgi:lysophospholipid acyltransferase
MLAFLDAAFDSAAPSVGLPKDHLKLLTVLYASVPLCAILKRLPDDKPYLKNLFNVAYLSPLILLFLLARC